jgi:hypothetical protein
MTTLLNPQDVALLFRLHRTLMFFANQRLKVLPDDLAISPTVAGGSDPFLEKE